MENRQANLSKTLAFQTPGGGKRKFKEEATPFTPHTRLFTKEDVPDNLSLKHIVLILKKLEIAILNLGQTATKNRLHQQEMSTSVVKSSNPSTQKIKN